MARTHTFLTIGALCAAGGPARADQAAPHVTRGEQLARDGRLTDAIIAFKRADVIEPRASHACLIALAYIRRELWPQAEVFLQTCHDRATPDDPLPDWVPLADQQLTERIDRAPVARVRIVVEPASESAATQLEVSSFLPDERFSPRTIHLPLGRHLITARTPGREPVERAIDVTDKSPRSILIAFDQSAVTMTREHASVVPKVLMASGGAVLVAGVLVHVLAFKPARDKLVDATNPGMPDPALYDEYSSKFDSRRNLTMALYGAGAALALTGIVLRYTVFRDRTTESPRLTSDLGSGRVLLGVEWAR